jgi:transposase
MKKRRPYPTDVSDEEWYFAAPYLTLMNKDARQRRYELRKMFNALRWIVRAGAPWRLLPNDFPPWEMVYQQTQRWIQAGYFQDMVNHLRSIIRVAQERRGQPSAVILDGRTLQSVDLRVGLALVTTATNANAAARSTWRLIPWGSCLPCM